MSEVPTLGIWCDLGTKRSSSLSFKSIIVSEFLFILSLSKTHLENLGILGAYNKENDFFTY